MTCILTASSVNDLHDRSGLIETHTAASRHVISETRQTSPEPPLPPEPDGK